MRRPWLLALALMLGLCLLWAPDAALGEAAFWAHDLRHHHLPWRAWSAGRWAAGELPLWAPEVGAGFPLMADGQTGVFYPPTQLLFLLLPAPLALNLSLLGHILLAGLGARALLRALGRSEAASLLGGVAFAFSGFMATHALYLGMQNAAAWLPWACCVLVQRRWPGLLLSVAMMGVAGHPQGAAFGMLLLGALALSEAWAARSARILLPFSAAMAGALLLCAPQLLATVELARLSLREGGLPAALAGQGSLPVLELVGGVLPRFFGYERPADIPETYYHRGAGYWGQGENHWEMAFYLGVPVVALALLGLRGARRWALLGGLALVLMLGEHTPLWGLLRRLPGLGGFRFPVRFSLVLTLCVTVLAGFGLDRALAMGREELARSGRRALLAAGALLLGLGAAQLGLRLGEEALEARLLARAERPLPPPPPMSPLQRAANPPPEERDAQERVAQVMEGLARSTRPWAWEALWPAGLLAALGVGALLLGRGRLSARAATGGVLALTVLDLFSFGRGYQKTFPMEEVLGEPGALAEIRAEGGRGRATVLDRRQDPRLDTELISASLGLLWGTRDVILPSPLRVVRQEAYLSKLGLDVGDRGAVKVERMLKHQALVDLLGVRWITTVHQVDHPAWTLVHDGEVRLYRNASALPPAFLVGCGRWLGEEDAEAAWAALDALDPRSFVVLEGEATALEACEDEAEPGSARIVEDRAERMVIAVDAAKAAVLVQTDTWYPGWTATVDGEPVGVRRADFLFRGIPVPAGRHEVVLEYKPGWMGWAWGGVVVGVVVLVGLGVVGWSGRGYRQDGKSARRTPACRSGDDGPHS